MTDTRPDLHLVPLPRTRSGGPAPDTTEALGLVLELCQELAAHAVRYCHFKSNDMLAKSLDGRNDLDLLVHRRDGARFREVLARLGFRRGLAPAGRDHPGVGHYYALDQDSGRLVHVHAHFQLVVGDDATKNFRLPIEPAYIASSVHDQPLPVPAPEFELAVFVVRMLLKHGTWDALLLGNGALGAGERAELAWLLGRTDLELCRAVVDTQLPWIGAELWDRCLASLGEGALRRIAPRRISLCRSVMVALRPHARRGRQRDTSVRVLRRVQWGLTWYVLRQPARKRLQHGGTSIAIVGGDGAGKSTAVAALADWLGGTFVVHQTHLGRPRPSLATVAGKGGIAVSRRLLGRRARPASVAAGGDGRAAVPDLPGALWYVLTARDRLREYRRLRRVSDSGGIVVSDRWPLPQLRLMDGSRVGWVLDEPTDASPAVRRLAAMERRIYASIAPPDVLVVLWLDPDVAVLRRPEDDPEYVRSRNGEVFETDWSRCGAVVVDASRPAEEVLATIREAVWSRL